MPDTIEEIVVTGQRPRPGFSWFEAGKGFELLPDYEIDTGGDGGGGTPLGAGLPAIPIVPVPQPPTPPIVARPIPPGGAKIIPFPQKPVLPNIIVTAKRIPPWLQYSRFTNVALLAGTIGTLWTDYVSQRRLDEAYAGFLYNLPKRDTPVRSVPPEVIEEITVTAPRPFPNLPSLPSWPYFQPWDNPPFEIPSAPPASVPRFEPLTIPAPPPLSVAPAPRPRTRTDVRPSILPGPGINPLTSPYPGFVASPQPIASPAPAPAPAPAPGPGPSPVPGPFGTPGLNVSPQPQPVPAPDVARKCKPCPKRRKKKEEKRTKCYKKMVEERVYERWDKVFNWQQIDCETGRPL